MPTVTHSFTLAASPEVAWGILSDFSRWSTLLVVENAPSKGWGTNWAVKEGSGAGMKLDMFFGDKLMQRWAVDEWAPQKRLKLSSRSCHHYFFMAMDSSLDITLTLVGQNKAQIAMTLQSAFCAPLFGSIFNSVVPLQKELMGILIRMEEGLHQSLTSA